MNPDDRARWFDDGFFPTPCNPVELNAVYSTRALWQKGRWQDTNERFMLLSERALKTMLSPHALLIEQRGVEAELLFYQLSVRGFKTPVQNNPIPHHTVARLQARLVVTNFSEAMYAAFCEEKGVTDVYGMSQAATDLTATMMDVERIYGAGSAAPYLAAGVTSISLIREALENNIDPSLAVDLANG